MKSREITLKNEDHYLKWISTITSIDITHAGVVLSQSNPKANLVRAGSYCKK